MKDPEFRREWEKLRPWYEITRAMIGQRLKRKMTQKQLAEKIGTTQSAIARLEAGSVNPSLAFLDRIAKGFGTTLKITFQE